MRKSRSFELINFFIRIFFFFLFGNGKMKKLAGCLLIVWAAQAAAAQFACAPIESGVNDLYYPRSSTPCDGYQNCTSRLCQCMGLSTNATTTSVEFCLNSSTLTNCSALQLCMRDFIHVCLNNLVVASGDTVINSCTAWAITLMSEMIEVVSSNTYANSPLQRSCNRLVCEALNGSSLNSTCDFGVNHSSICSPINIFVATDPPVAAGNFTQPPWFTPAPFVATTEPPRAGVGSHNFFGFLIIVAVVAFF